MIYHIAERQRWHAAQTRRGYRAASLETEGFIHCSTRGQLDQVAGRLFRGRRDLVLLSIDETRVEARIVYENLEGGAETYPHIYGELNLDAVSAADDFTPPAA